MGGGGGEGGEGRVSGGGGGGGEGGEDGAEGVGGEGMGVAAEEAVAEPVVEEGVAHGEGLVGAREGDEGLAEGGGEGGVLGEFQEQVGDGGALLGGVGFMFHSAPSVAWGRADGTLDSLQV